MSEFKDVLIGFIGAVLVVGLGYFLFVRPCNVIPVDTTQETRCKCLGKVVNLKLLLGDRDALELPKVEHCVGVVTKRF